MVSALGLGCMGMSGMYGPATRAESLATLHSAIDAGERYAAAQMSHLDSER